MRKIIAILLCTALLLPLLSCGKKATGNALWAEGSPETSAMQLFVFDQTGGRSLITFDQSDEHAILDRLSAVDALPVTDWTVEKVRLPVYGIEIGTADGRGILTAWSDGYLILRDGSVYRFDFDFAALESNYAWEPGFYNINSLSDMPCGRLLSQGTDGWITNHLSPSKEPTPPERISMVLKEQTAETITVELTNSSSTEWCYGEYFSLSVLLDGVWYDVPVLDDKNYAFTDIGILLPAGESHEKTYNLFAYGTLPAGHYHLVVEGMSVEFIRPYMIKSIVDHSLDNPGLVFAAVLEPFWEDDASVYSFSCPKSDFVTVYYTDGTEEDVKTALQAGRITTDDLDAFGIRYYTEPKA